jgi:hypothetical protein
MTAEQLYPDRPDLIERFRACMAQQSVITYETDYHSRGAGQDGVIVFTFAFVSPELILLHAEDVTERRRAEDSAARPPGKYAGAAGKHRRQHLVGRCELLSDRSEFGLPARHQPGFWPGIRSGRLCAGA